jgi:4-amino-4-deoxy-L-arabinose transferase-like glycosyltransferase
MDVSKKRLYERSNAKKFVTENYPLFSVLVGYLLVAFSTGPYYNGDVAWETQAIQGVMKYGLPYTNGFFLMDQPPLGFYIQAVFAEAFGFSIASGTMLVTLFGLGSVILVYLVGKSSYDKSTGFLAALLFAFAPWQLIMSRIMLIDAPCMFLSLLTLYVGLTAIKKGSFKLIVAAGFIFAMAFNTKLYAAFILIPLLGYFLYQVPKNLKTTVTWVLTFSLPSLCFTYMWYETVTGLGLFSIFGHTDFNVSNPAGFIPTYFFATNFLVNYGLGWFFIDAMVLSLLIYLFKRNWSRDFIVFDILCVAVALFALGVNTFLGAELNMKAPYLDAFKYDFQTLPFFSLLAASLVTKSLILFRFAASKPKIRRMVFYLFAAIGITVVGASIVYNLRFANLFSNVSYILFRVAPEANIGYSLVNTNLTNASMFQVIVEYVGFALALSGLSWISKSKIISMIRFLEKKCC